MAHTRVRARGVFSGLSAIAARTGLLALLAVGPLACVSSATFAQSRDATTRQAILLNLRGAIGPATAEYLQNGLKTAARRHAALVVLQLDTPGGLDSAMRDIVRAILASPVPVTTYVSPSGARAASAGTYIVYASQIAAMAPGTTLGAATPVQFGNPAGLPGRKDGGGDGSGSALHAKMVNDAAAFIRGLAELRGRNGEWAEQAVRQAVSLQASEALQQGVIDIVAPSVDDLLRQADGRVVQVGQQAVTLHTAGVPVVRVDPGWRTRLLAVITDPNIAYILLLIGIYGIILEFLNPGTILPGVTGAVSLVLGLFALNLLPVNFAGIGLIGFGAALMVAEILTPSFGLLGVGGIAAFVFGSFLLFDAAPPALSLSPAVIIAATAVFAAIVLVAGGAVVRAHRRRVTTGDPDLIGSIGEVLVWSGRKGAVQVHGERWQARGAGTFSPGDRVRIAARDRLTLRVEPESRTRQGETK